MKIGMVITGVAFLGIGGAIAYFVPPIIAKASKEKAAIPTLTADNKKDLAVGGQVLVHGKLSPDNPVFEKDLVVGSRQVWGVSSNPDERESHRRKLRKHDKDADKRHEQWWPDQEFKRQIQVAVDGVGPVALSPNSGVVSGKPARVEDKVEDEQFRWEGARRGDEISAIAKITSLDPLEVETQMGDLVFVGTPDQLHAQAAKADRFTLYAMYGLGGLFALIGLIVLPIGVVKG